MKNKKAIAAVASGTGLSVLAGLFLWWDTNVFAATELCAGKLTGEQAESLLDTRGRISDVTEGISDDVSFRCTVSRTSRITGAEELEMVMNTAVYTPDFPFSTYTWDNSSSRSFLSGEVTGAVSGSRGWVMLPEKCGYKVRGVLERGVKLAPAPDNAQVVQVELKKGTVDPQKLTRVLVDAAQKVAAAAGCSNDTPLQTPKVQAPTSPEAITADSLCGIPGFHLPDSAVAKGDAKLEVQRTSGAPADSWACDLYRSGGQDEPRLSFGSSFDPNIVNERLRSSAGFEDLADGTGVVDGNSRAILKCGGKDLYLGVHWDDRYLRALYRSDPSDSASRDVFQSFFDAAGKQHGCPSVKLPSDSSG
ncbi:hypothetical protein [Streptomyces sp. SID14515]|uniref:hypothetical protein n=1 Tax=Streptomyces sp. SID14515 TaxID=2706074 RepID=UPI0013CA6599|nr:hypothetical protein [Streptomyces sp. SID14515]NEB40684.1 hypothetical protein [Streptomyces sp. SID14515]